MIASDVINRFEKRVAMIEREKMEYQGRIPSKPGRGGPWGTYRNNSGINYVSISKVKSGERYNVSIGVEFLGSFINMHTAVDKICNYCKITPMQIAGMTKPGWDLIKSQPIIPGRTYKGGVC